MLKKLSVSILLSLLVVTAGSLAGLRPVSAQDKTLTVFAAASMKNALDDVDAAYTRKTGTKVTVSYAASSALMKQIEQGAPADVFVSADLDWMDYGSQKKVIKDATRVNLLGNRIVLIAPKDSKIADVAIGAGFDLAKLHGRIRPGVVPVGEIVSQRRRSPGPHQASGDARCRARWERPPLLPSAHAASRANRATSFPFVSRPNSDTHQAHPH